MPGRLELTPFASGLKMARNDVLGMGANLRLDEFICQESISLVYMCHDSFLSSYASTRECIALLRERELPGNVTM